MQQQCLSAEENKFYSPAMKIQNTRADSKCFVPVGLYKIQIQIKFVFQLLHCHFILLTNLILFSFLKTSRRQDVPKPAERSNLTSVSLLYPGVSSRMGMPGTSPQGDAQEASWPDTQTTSTGSSRCRGAAALLWASPQMSELLVLSQRLNPATMQRNIIIYTYIVRSSDDLFLSWLQNSKVLCWCLLFDSGFSCVYRLSVS